MMDENRGSLFGLGQRSNNLANLSPYLNIDPTYLQSQAPEFIVDNEMKPGNLEKSFAVIGSALFVGGAAGGAYGLFDGVRQTSAAGLTGRLRRTQIINHTLKSGGAASNSLGAITFMYSSLYCLMSLANEEGDDAKSLASGALTGALYKSSAGLKKCGLAGAFGLGLAAVWSFAIKKNETVSNYV